MINDKLGELNYRLELPKDAKVHLVFYVLLLELADLDTELQTTFYYES